MDSLLRECAHRDLSDAQFKIFDDVSFTFGSATSATAGAGAGKTRTLSFLVAKALIDPRVDGVHILTATTVAKNEAVARVVSMLQSTGLAAAGARPIDPYNVRTIHSVALENMRREAEAHPELAGVEVVPPTKIIELLRKFVLEAYSSMPTDVPDLLAPEEMPATEAAEFLHSVRAERINNCQSIVDDSLGFVARHALAALEQHMALSEAGTRLCDYAAMVDRMRVEGTGLCGAGCVLFVDEAQDLSQCQLEIVLNTLRLGASVVVLGDDSQGIFQFSGACNMTIREFERRCEAAGASLLRHHLFKNFRSTDAIVKVSERLLPATDRLYRVGVSGNGADGKPVEALVTDGEHADALAERVVALLREGYGPGDVVVLRHKNFHNGDPLVLALRAAVARAGVEAPVAVGGASGSETLHGRFLAVMQAVHEGHVDQEGVVAFLKALKCTRGCPQLAVRAVRKVLERIQLFDTLSAFAKCKGEFMAAFKELEAVDDAKTKSSEAPKKKKLKSGGSQKLNNFELLLNVAIRAVAAVRALAHAAEWGKPLERVALDRSVAALTGTKYGRADDARQPLGQLVFRVLNDIVHSPPHATDAADANELLREFDTDINLTDTVAEALASPLAQLHARVHDTETGGKVLFSTIHKFKGLERPVAFVVQLKEPWAKASWPQRAALSTHHELNCKNKSGKEPLCCARFGVAVEGVCEAMVAEKRRLHYVAASRAQERLFLHADAGRPGDPLQAVVSMAGRKMNEWVRI
jgi:superfamily I DNA/RNA helicase